MKILCLFKGMVHPTLGCQIKVKKYIKEYYGTKKVYSSSLSKISKLNSKEYDLIILYFHIKEDDESIIESLYKYVNEGGTILGIHGVAASFKKSEKWFDLLGGKFISHPPIGNIQISYKDKKYEIIDELYRYKLKDVEVFIKAELNNDKEACAWKKSHGKGNVYYYSLGHNISGVKSKVFKELLYEILRSMDNNE